MGKWLNKTDKILMFFIYIHISESEVAQSCPTLCNPMDSSLHQAPPSMGFLWQEVLEWVAISFSRESSQPRDRTQVSHIGGPCIYTHTYIYTLTCILVICSLLHYCTILWASLVAQMVKNLPAVWETQVQSLAWEDMLYSTILVPLLLFSHHFRLPWWLTQ